MPTRTSLHLAYVCLSTVLFLTQNDLILLWSSQCKSALLQCKLS